MLMRLNLENQNRIAIAIVSVSLGICLGIILDNLISNPGFKYDPEVSFEVDLVGIVTLIVTIIIALILEKNLNTNERVRGAERDAFIKHLTIIDADFTSKVRKLAGGGYELTHVTQVIKRHRMRANKLIDLAIQHSLISSDSEGAKTMLSNIKNILELMTDTPREGEIENGVRVTGGNLQYSEKRKDEIVSELFDFNSTVFELTVETHK